MDRYESTFRTWDQLATQYQDKFMNLDLYNDTYDLFCDYVKPKNATILEIGCGPGNITKYILTKRPDFKLLGTDVSPIMIELARKNIPSASFKIMDCRYMNELKQKFDGILCGFVIPYLTKDDVAKLIRDCASLLNNNGVLYLSAIEGDYRKSTEEKSSDGKHSVFVHYYDEEYLNATIKDYGFESIQFIRKPYQKADGSNWAHLICIANKK